MSPRRAGIVLSVSVRRQYADAVRAVLETNPEATVAALMAAVPGAPPKLVSEVRRLWRFRREFPEAFAE